MKKYFLFITLLILFPDNTDAVKKSDTSRILLSNTARHAFSDPLRQDVFKLTLTGTSLLGSQATLEILDQSNKSLYKKSFKATLLVDELLVDAYNWNTKQQEDELRKRVREFFKEESFYKPAINLKEPFYDDEATKTIWDDIRADRTAIGFGYLLSYENYQKIAWSKKQKKVVVYWACC